MAPVTPVDGQVGIDALLLEPGGAITPVNIQLIGQEVGTHTPAAARQPASGFQLPHTGVHDRNAGFALGRGGDCVWISRLIGGLTVADTRLEHLLTVFFISHWKCSRQSNSRSKRWVDSHSPARCS